jgi:pilus assembly protein CpaB
MKPKTMILMVVAVGCGLVASYMTSRLLSERNAAQPEEEKVTVLVAKNSLSMGTRVKEPEKLFVEKQFVAGQEPKKAIRSFDQVKDRLLNKSLAAEQFVTSDDLLDKNMSNLDAQLPPGMRAVAIKVGPDSLAGGYVLPQSHVDVLSTMRRGDESTTQTILQNVLVLAVDQQDIRDQERKTILGGTATLALNPEDAQKVKLAQTLGELGLVLRGLNDDTVASLKATTPRDVARQSRNGGSGNPTNGDDSDTSGVIGGPAVPAVPVITPPPPKVEEKPPVVVKDEKPEPVKPAPKTFTQVIWNGPDVKRVVYIEGAEDEAQALAGPEGDETKPAPKKSSAYKK